MTLLVARQLRQLEKEPLHNIAISSTEQGLLQCCANIRFPIHSNYPGLVLHFWVDFPPTFPNEAPLVSLKSYIEHTHVFFPKLCFSIVPDFSLFFEKVNASSEKWNPSITIRSFLVQLYIFLVDDCDREVEHRLPITSVEQNRAMSAARDFQCTRCSHTFGKPFPRIELFSDSEDLYSLFDIQQTVVNQLTMQKQPICVLTSDGQVKLVHKQPEKNDYEEAFSFFICFFSGKNSDQDAIGFAVRKRYSSSTSTPLAFQVRSDFSPISHSSFYDDKIRRLRTGKLSSHWLPFAIGNGHWRSALECAKQSILDIHSDRAGDVFEPLMAFDVIGSILNHCLYRYSVDFREYGRPLEYRVQQLCMIHHILISFAMEYHEIVEECDAQLDMVSLNDFSLNMPFNPIVYCLCSSRNVHQLFGALCAYLLSQNFSLVTLKHPTFLARVFTRASMDVIWNVLAVVFVKFAAQLKWLQLIGRKINETLSDTYFRYERTCGRISEKEMNILRKETIPLLDKNVVNSFETLEKALLLKENSFDPFVEVQNIKTNLPTYTFHTQYDIRSHGPGALLAIVGNCPELGDWNISKTTAIFKPFRIENNPKALYPESTIFDQVALFTFNASNGHEFPPVFSSEIHDTFSPIPFYQHSVRGDSGFDCADDYHPEDYVAPIFVDEKQFFEKAVDVAPLDEVTQTRRKVTSPLLLTSSQPIVLTNTLSSPLLISGGFAKASVINRYTPFQKDTQLFSSSKSLFHIKDRTSENPNTLAQPKPLNEQMKNDNILSNIAKEYPFDEKKRVSSPFRSRSTTPIKNYDGMSSKSQIVSGEKIDWENEPPEDSTIDNHNLARNKTESLISPALNSPTCEEFDYDGTSPSASLSIAKLSKIHRFKNLKSSLSDEKSSQKRSEAEPQEILLPDNLWVTKVSFQSQKIVFWKMIVVKDGVIVRWEDGNNRILEVSADRVNHIVPVLWNIK